MPMPRQGNNNPSRGECSFVFSPGRVIFLPVRGNIFLSWELGKGAIKGEENQCVEGC